MAAGSVQKKHTRQWKLLMIMVNARLEGVIRKNRRYINCKFDNVSMYMHKEKEKKTNKKILWKINQGENLPRSLKRS